MTPYVGTVFDLTLEIVNSPDAATKDQELWLAVLRMLGKSFEVDEDRKYCIYYLERNNQYD
jgi:hypothetical protein